MIPKKLQTHIMLTFKTIEEAMNVAKAFDQMGIENLFTADDNQVGIYPTDLDEAMVIVDEFGYNGFYGLGLHDDSSNDEEDVEL